VAVSSWLKPFAQRTSPCTQASFYLLQDWSQVQAVRAAVDSIVPCTYRAQRDLATVEGGIVD
jgi:hypothetical protein